MSRDPGLVAVLIAALACTSSAQTPLLQFPNTGVHVGSRVAGAGDVDADGTPDLLISQDTRVRVASGKDGSTLFDIDAPNASLAPAGDVNLDGHADVIVGIYGQCTARVISGATTNVLFEFFGDLPPDLFGIVVAGPGDVNGDGVPDLMVGAGAPNSFTGGSPLPYVRVFSGASGAPLFTLTLHAEPDTYEIIVAGVGDLTLDGLADVAVGQPTANESQGSIAAFSGDGSPLFGAKGNHGGRFGSSIAGIGDVSGDGHPDLAVGAPSFIFLVGTLGSSLHVLSGVDGSTLHTILGEVYEGHPSSCDGLGVSVAGIGDVNRDGAPDFFAGAPGFMDPAPPYSTGAARVFSGAGYGPLVSIFGPPGNSGLGFTLARVGDLDGDGRSDVIVGSGNVGATVYSLAGP